MRTTLALDDELVAKAQAVTGLKENPPWSARR
jgi:Arc/MetJ family transcription regulator